MSDLISKGELFNALASAHDKSEIFAIINNAPTVDAKPVRHGHWIEDNGCQICSNCGEEHEWEEYRANYCDVCGAKMDEQVGNSDKMDEVSNGTERKAD